jgi:E3 ubiquitin-protein ligase RNF139
LKGFSYLELVQNLKINSHFVKGGGADDNNQNNEMNGGDNELTNVGDVAAILFFLLSVQSGLSSLHAKHRIEKFFKNYSLLFIAILHYFHTTFDAQLMTLSASSTSTATTTRHHTSERHIRTLGLSLALILTPLGILVYMVQNYSLSTWLLAATAFNLELIVKMSVSLVLYALFSIEANRVFAAYKKTDSTSESAGSSSNSFSEKLDDYVYYVKAFGHVFEFVIALILFFNGAYILLFESYGAIRACMMVIHAYFHIWCQARKGWSAFVKRRTAVAKLRQLAVFDKVNYTRLMQRQRTASSDVNNNAVNDNDEAEDGYEMRTHDVCAICFAELGAYESRITNCHHIFHFVCLRKWLYLQDRCPMCHQLVYQLPGSSAARQDEAH